MVYISRLTLKGFKSFPQRPVSVLLEPGFTAITGPNGSGKSNIFDAIRFALGENSPKMLRHNKMSDLINDQVREESAAARVSMTLDNSDKSLPVDSDRVVVTRELHKNGDSAYYVEGKRVQRNQYLEFLGVAHLSPDGLNIIAQGTIQRLAELTPDERRAAVEQYLGLKHFDEKKSEAMARLREADNELAISFAKLDERREAIERLQSERNDSMRLRQVQHEIARVRKAGLLRDIERLDSETESAKKRLEELNAQRVQAEKGIVALEGEKKGLEAERDAYYSTSIAGPNRRLTELDVAVGQFRRETEELQERKRKLLEGKAALEQAIPQLQGMHASSRAELDGLQQKVDSLRSRISAVEGETAGLREQAGQKAGRRDELAAAKESLLPRQGSLLEARRVLEERSSLLKAELRSVAERSAKTRGDLAELQKKHGDLASMSQSFSGMVEEIAKSLPEKKERLQQLEGSAETQKAQRRRLAKDISQAEAVLEDATQTVTKYVSGRELAERFFGEELNATKVEELARSGAVDGFRGVLSSHISYDQKYAAAVRAAGRDWVSAFLVDDMGSLVQLATMAKKLRTGRVGILPISELEGTPVLEPPAEEGVLGNVADFVRCDKGDAPAVDFVFGNTLLVDTAKKAFVLARRGHRCVTLNGDLFEPKAAAMETGRLSELTLTEIGLSDPDSIRVAEESLKALKESLDRRKKSREKLEESIESLDSQKFSLGLEVRELQSSLKNYRYFAKRYAVMTARAARRVAAGESLIKRLETRGASLQRRIDSVAARLARVEQRTAALGVAKIDQEATELEAQLASISADIEARNRSVLSLNAEISSYEARLNGEVRPRLVQIEKSLRQSAAELESALAELPRTDAKIAELGERLQTLSQEEKRVREEDERALPRLRELESLVKAKDQETSAVRQRLLRIERDVLKAEGTIEGLLASRSLTSNELSSLGVEEPVFYASGFDSLLADLQGEERELRDRVNLLAVQSYYEAFASYRKASERRNELEKDRNAIVSFIDKVEKEKKAAFMLAFEKLDKEVRAIFAKLTGSDGWLELEDPEDPFAGGMFMMARFQSNTARESSSLSGGEKAITAVPFLLAFQSIYPSGFYLFDEVDAALDQVYAQGLGSLMAEWSSRAQIISISFKESVVGRATNLIGVYRTNGLSNAVRIRKEVQVDVRTEQR